MAKKKNAVRKDGRIAVQVYLGRDANNKRQYKTVYGSNQKEADEKALQVKLAMRKGIDVTARDSFADWADRFLKQKALEVTAGRCASYASAVKHLNRAIGNIQITKIRAADIQSILNELAAHNPNTGRPTAPQTLSIVKITASQIFEMAIENRLLEYNPAGPVKVITQVEPQRRRALTREEQRWIDDFPHPAQRAAMIMMYAGLRRGELIALTWNDINLKERTISINKAVECISGNFVVKNTGKTKASIRTVDIPMKLVEFLQDEPRDSLYVAANRKRAMHSASSWKNMWKSYLQGLNQKYGDIVPKPFVSGKGSAPCELSIPKITPHWLRHTYATNLYFAGVDMLTAKEQLGHSDIRTTLEIYTHLDAQYKRKVMDKLDDYFNECKSGASHEDRKAK